MPPSTRNSASSTPLSARMASSTSAVWKAVDSKAARAKCPLLV